MAKTHTGELLKVTDPDDLVEQVVAADEIDPDAQIPDVQEEYTPEPPIPFEASSGDIVEQRTEVPLDLDDDYR